MHSIEVIGLGALNIDQIYQVERILDDGETVVNEAQSFPGGSAANTIYGLAKLGISTGFAGVVGNDAEGQILVQDFQKVEVDTSQIKVKPEAKTGAVLCLSDRLGKRSLYVSPGVNNWLTMADLDLTYINQARILHLSSFANDRQLQVLLELIDKLDSSVKVSFSPGTLFAGKGLKVLTPILARTYVLFINESEMRQLTGEDFIAGADTCLKQGCNIVTVTLGRGLKLEWQGKEITAVSYIRHAENKHMIELSTKNVTSILDTTGAGDAFAAGFLYGLLTGKSLEECGRLGDIVAQFKIAKMGARPGLPTLAKLTKRYHELYSEQL